MSVENHNFIWEYEWELFLFEEGFIIDGTSDGAGCDIFIFDESNKNDINICYDENTITLNINDRFVNSFEFSKNFEAVVWREYQAFKK